MFELFTPEARRTVVKAQERARALNHGYIGTEHLLLGVIDVDGIAADALRTLGVSPGDARRQVVKIVGTGAEPPGGHIPFTPRAKKALEQALRESKRLRHPHIGPEHILLGLIGMADSVAVQALTGLGTGPSAVRAEVLRLLAS
jgi:ATP-dependent Clp protease ATP-binding subunit ClpC